MYVLIYILPHITNLFHSYLSSVRSFSALPINFCVWKMNISFLFLGNFSDKLTTVTDYHILDESNDVQNNFRIFL